MLEALVILLLIGWIYGAVALPSTKARVLAETENRVWKRNMLMAVIVPGILYIAGLLFLLAKGL